VIRYELGTNGESPDAHEHLVLTCRHNPGSKVNRGNIQMLMPYLAIHVQRRSAQPLSCVSAATRRGQFQPRSNRVGIRGSSTRFWKSISITWTWSRAQFVWQAFLGAFCCLLGGCADWVKLDEVELKVWFSSARNQILLFVCCSTATKKKSCPTTSKTRWNMSDLQIINNRY